MTLRIAPPGGQLSSADVAHNFADIAPPLSRAEALAESARCLYCFDAPCMNACPTHIDVPGFIKRIGQDNLKGAAKAILTANPMGHSCARACPVESLCEGACVVNQTEGRPVQIARMQRYATDAALVKGWQPIEPGKPTGKSVAVVGAGPAGLSCAQELRRFGHDVVVYDARKEPGGLNTFGIAQYKLTPETAKAEAKTILDLGVTLKSGVVVDGKGGAGGVAFDDLVNKHDAVFLGLGLSGTKKMGIPGEGLQGVVDALTFIEQLKAAPYGTFKAPQRVLVVGAGNTAVDAATQARRLGAAEVGFVYRRGRDDVSAYDYEVDLALGDGCTFHFHTAPVEVEGVGGKVTGLKVAAAKDGAPVAGSERVIPCDLVVVAIGQGPHSDVLKRFEVNVDGKGKAVVDEHLRTSRPKVFAGGDCINGGKEIVNAAADGVKAARSIHSLLTASSGA